jgi:hypothetical protein
MKQKILFMLCTVVITFGITSCKLGTYSIAGGKTDQAYLLFVSSDIYSGKTVQVSIDGTTKFNAKVVKEKNSNLKGNLYAIATGSRNIKVEKDGKVLYEKTIFASNQETKKIVLP